MDHATRAHSRFPAGLTVEIFTGPTEGSKIGAGSLLDISLGGCLLQYGGLLNIGATYRLRCVFENEYLDMPGRMVRGAGKSSLDPKARRYGLEFTLTYDQEKALRRLIDRIREGGTMTGDWTP